VRVFGVRCRSVGADGPRRVLPHIGFVSMTLAECILSCPESSSASALQVYGSTSSENRGSGAHKLVFVGVAFALGVGDVRNTAHGPALDPNLQPSG
jgi:hypothetical protein